MPNCAAASGMETLYSCELICGVITGVSRGGTGQMSVLGRGGRLAIACGGSFKEGRSLSCSFGWGDGEALIWASGVGMDRGSYHPCSARNRARNSEARWRAASSSWGLAGAGGVGAGQEGFGA